MQLLKVLAPLRVLSFPGWGTTVCDVATLEHTISFGNKGMPPAVDAWVSRSLHGLMDLPAYRATALGRAAAKYVHDRLMQLPVAQALDFMWYQALASVSALRTFRGPAAQWRSFSRRDAIPAWGRLYNRLHPGVDIYSVHFVKKMPWCQYFNGHGSRTDCQLPDGSEVSLAVMLPDSLGGSVKYIKGFAFEIRTSFPQDLAAPKQAYVRNMQVVVSHEQRDYRGHAELVGEEGFTFVPDFSSVKPSRHGVSVWHHVLGVHSDRIPSILGVASRDAPRSYLPPRVEYVGFARDLEQAFNLLACSLRAPDGTGWVSFDHLVRSELTWQGECAEGWCRLLECGPTFLFNVLRLSTGPDGHFMSVLIGVFHALSSQRIAFGIR